MMMIIRTKTNKMFIPTVIQNSPINTQTEMLIILRNIEKSAKFQLDALDLEETKLAKQFVLRSF